MTPETTPKQPENDATMRPTHLFPATRLCLCGCGKSFVQTRKWHVYYSTACKKRGNAQIARRSVPSDLRATLTRIEIKLDGIIKSITEGKS